MRYKDMESNSYVRASGAYFKHVETFVAVFEIIVGRHQILRNDVAYEVISVCNFFAVHCVKKK